MATSDGSEDSNGGRSTVFTNNCDRAVFVIYCGDSLYGEGECGQGPNQGYFVFSGNIEPGNSYESVAIREGGNIVYGACFGGISFGNDGEFIDHPDGTYECLDRSGSSSQSTDSDDYAETDDKNDNTGEADEISEDSYDDTSEYEESTDYSAYSDDQTNEYEDEETLLQDSDSDYESNYEPADIF